jgi:four helix bundle protein
MPTAQHFENLTVWQEARRLVGAIFSASKTRTFDQDFDLRDQIRRAAIATMFNIAEGFERRSRQEFVQCLNIAKRSNGQLRSQLYVAWGKRYIAENEFETLRQSIAILSKKISAFIRYLENCADNARVKKPGRSSANNQQPQ